MSSLTPREPFGRVISLREALGQLFEDSMVGLDRFCRRIWTERDGASPTPRFAATK